MERKPVTDLAVLPSLELIPTESLPARRGEELALLKKERKTALGAVISTGSLTPVIGLFTVIYAWVTFLAWSSAHAPLALILLVTLISIGFSVFSVVLMREFASDVRKYWQTAIPPQLETDVKAEIIISDAAKRLNGQIAEWNIDATEAAQNSVDREVLMELRTHRKHLENHGKHLKRLSAHLNRKR